MVKLKSFVYDLIENAKKKNSQLEVKEAIKIHFNKINFFINISGIGKIKKSGCFLDTKHIQRNILEFWIEPINRYFSEFFNKNFNFLFYYALNWHATLAMLTANNIELLNTSYLIGCYNKWLELEDPIQEAR